MFKKFAALAAAAALSLGVMTGCGASGRARLMRAAHCSMLSTRLCR